MNKTYYTFMDLDGNYYAGMSVRWSKNLKDARLFVSEKTAYSNFYSRTLEEYKNAILVKVNMTVQPMKDVDADVDFANNSNYQRAKKRS